MWEIIMHNVSLDDVVVKTKVTEEMQMLNELRYMVQNCCGILQRIESYLTVDKEIHRRDAFMDGVNYATDVAKKMRE